MPTAKPAAAQASAIRQAERLEEMTKPPRPMPDAPVVEIVERGKRSGPGPEGVIVPDDVRINGVSVLCADEPVVVHEINLSPSCDAIRVTLTLLARRVVIGAELD